MNLILRMLTAVLVVAGFPRLAGAAQIDATPDRRLQAVVDQAQDGDIVELAPGEFRGPIRIEHPISLVAKSGATVIGDGASSVITVTSPDVTIRGITIKGSGRNLQAMDSAVFLAKTAERALVENNRIEGNLFGVYVHGATDAQVRGNIIEGLRNIRIAEAGNGVSVWNSPGAKIVGNDIRFGRDGIFVNASRNNTFSGNRFHDLRFAVHYMYTNDSEVSDNVSVGNTVGFAIMYSHHLRVRGNVSDGDRDHGLLLNFANNSEISGNLIRGRLQPRERWLSSGLAGKIASEHGMPIGEGSGPSLAQGARIGPEKCVFIYNANKNRFFDNRFEGCEIGIHFTAGSEGNEIVGNAFIGNRNQVKYVGTRYLDWSKDGRGNFWSDNPAFDLNGDGIADAAYRPNDIIDKVLWTAPEAKVLVNSPAVQIIRWAQARFPALLPGGVVDTHPLMAPPSLPAHPHDEGALP
ncbi:periplasmic copper-binding protein [Hyphomicrobium denitrificans 1NES1]|uniref:Periplasmic copper-binding protein n=1 Tax=Hyphomicrobium denitrificans 1NES1 TaxID=670307 RepID=N0B227_9HYPH|nr:nitrous oxide reductase family maturation protein NosD [Hyphomicrobium denitrificans]AGK57509.1 periplasmic copper-binding protein [Hyphomicrobium denitrificans 1NES1]